MGLIDARLHIKWLTKNIDGKVKEELEEVIRKNIA